MKKVNKEQKERLIRMISKNPTPVEWVSLADVSKSSGLKKSFVAKQDWRCLMDVVKSRLTSSIRASDIAIP